MSRYTKEYIRGLRNDIAIDEVISDILNLEVRKIKDILRFRCPQCYNFHTATNHQTNLARCFDCKQNFNPIDMVMTVGKCGFIDAVELLSKHADK